MFNTYTNLKPKIEEVAVFWTRSNSFFSKLIRLVIGAEVSHTGFLIRENGRIMSYEMMQGDKCRQIPASNRFGTDEEIIVANVKVKNKTEFLNSVYADVGVIGYDLKGVLISLFYRSKSANKYCSLWVAEKLGLKFEHLRRGVTPADVLDALQDKVVK